MATNSEMDFGKQVSPRERKRICLNMILRNESHVIRDLISPLAHLIDYWVIVDTGSDDETQDVIRQSMADLEVPGEFHERSWRDFGYNRAEAIELAQGRADFTWVMVRTIS